MQIAIGVSLFLFMIMVLIGLVSGGRSTWGTGLFLGAMFGLSSAVLVWVVYAVVLAFTWAAS
jgi:hypothetical protein